MSNCLACSVLIIFILLNNFNHLIFEVFDMFLETNLQNWFRPKTNAKKPDFSQAYTKSSFPTEFSCLSVPHNSSSSKKF